MTYNMCFAAWVYYDSFYYNYNRPAWAMLTLLFGFIAVPVYFLKTRENNENYINFFKYFGSWLIGLLIFSIIISGGTILRIIDNTTLLQASVIVFMIFLFYVVPKYFIDKSNEKLTPISTKKINGDSQYSFSFKRIFKKITNDTDSRNIVHDVSLMLLVYTLLNALGYIVSGRLNLLVGNFINLGLIFLLWKYNSRTAALLLIPSSCLFIFIYAYRLAEGGSVFSNCIEIVIQLLVLWAKFRTIEATFKIHGFPLKVKEPYQLAYKIYFWVLTVSALPLYFFIPENELSKINILIDFFASIISLIGLFGYVYKKPIFRSVIWKVWFIICIGWQLYYFTLTDIPDNSEIPIVGKIIFMIIFIAFMFPFYLALYLYGYKSDQLWESAQNDITSGSSGRLAKDE